MIADFRRRFWVCLVLTIPILALSPAIQQFLGLGGRLSFNGDGYILFALSSAVMVYGGYPFLKGFISELRSRAPGAAGRRPVPDTRAATQPGASEP